MSKQRHEDTSPVWLDSAPFPQFSKLTDDARADVVVVGGGVTGLTTAYLLVQAGKSVVLLERERCAMADTGHTSAHLTMVTDSSLTELEKQFGRTHAQAVWDAGLAAIAQVDRIVRDEDIDAGFQWTDGFLHLPTDRNASRDVEALKAEAQLAHDRGFDVEYLAEVPLFGVPGLRVDGQARIHPRKYLAGLAKALIAAGGRIHEHSPADEFSIEPRAVKANGCTIRCGDVVIATHNPLVGFGESTAAALFQTKLALYTSYVVGGRVPKHVVPDALWWDTADPYHYLRIEPHRDHDVVIFGGEDHKTGQEPDTEGCYDRLEERIVRLIPAIELTHRWSGQVIETPDGLPYIGASAPRQYSATGYSGNGMTFGTVAAMLIADAICQRRSPWATLFDPARTALSQGLWDYIKENADYPYYLIRDRFAGAEGRSLRALKRGEGKLIEQDGTTVAAYRDSSGKTTTRSATCTHMGCFVAWNAAESTWDCPCHGSRFKPTGEVIAGPAEAPLSDVE